jgi:hypothetical protein
MEKDFATQYKEMSRREILKGGSTAAATLVSTSILMAAAACSRSATVATGPEEPHLFKVLAFWLAVTTKGLPSPIPASYKQDLMAAAAFDTSVGDTAIFSALYNWIIDANNKPAIEAASTAYGQLLQDSIKYSPAQCPTNIQVLSKLGKVDPNA